MVGGKRQESDRDIINLCSNIYIIDNDSMKTYFANQVENILESNQSSLPNEQGHIVLQFYRKIQETKKIPRCPLKILR